MTQKRSTLKAHGFLTRHLPGVLATAWTCRGRVGPHRGRGAPLLLGAEDKADNEGCAMEEHHSKLKSSYHVGR